MGIYEQDFPVCGEDLVNVQYLQMFRPGPRNSCRTPNDLFDVIDRRDDG